jgi:hypothetical protein
MYLIDQGPSWPWSYGSWTYNYLCNKCLLLLMLWVRISIRARCTALCDKVCQRLATCQWFSTGSPVSSTNKIDLPRYNWNIVESGVKHHATDPPIDHVSAYNWSLVGWFPRDNDNLDRSLLCRTNVPCLLLFVIKQ